MDIKKEQNLFYDLKKEYTDLLESIYDDDLKNLYSNFHFKYLNCEKSEQSIVKKLNDFLDEFDFISYDIFLNNNSNYPTTCNAVICVEKQCLYIEFINKEMFCELINKHNFHSIKFDSNDEVKDEVESFCNRYFKQIKSNEFVKNTIHAISTYIIRRFYFPSNCFKDPSFFEYKKQKKKFVNFKNFDSQELINKVIDDKNKKEGKNQIEYFNEDDFINLRVIKSKENSLFYLGFHIKSQYLFVIKKINSDEFEHEIQFCSKFSDRCLTHFYGFIKQNQKISGFVYEFMSNGTFDSFILKQNDSINNIFYCHLSILRILQGIKYIHSKSNIHLDLKPQNILINHDFVPFLSDFDKVKEVHETNDFTKDVGSDLYMAPEQYSGNYSFSADIYSFGLFIYFSFEKKNLFKSVKEYKKYQIKEESKIPIPTQELIQKCIDIQPENRPTINDIYDRIIDKLKSFQFLEIPFLQSIKEINISVFHNNFNEMYHLLFVNPDNNLDFIKSHKVQVYQLLNLMIENDIPEVFNSFGELFLEGECIEHDFNKAKLFFEISEQYNNSNAIKNIGKMHLFGKGVVKDYQIALKYFERAASLNNAIAFNNLGICYLYNLGVKNENYKAKDYFEKAIQMNYRLAYCNLGLMYLMGKGVEKNYEKARENFEILAEDNNPVALCNLGHLYLFGHGVQKNYDKAIEYFERSSKLNYHLADVNLGKIYVKGKGVVKDYLRAKFHFEKAAKQNNSDAIFLLGKLYFNGNGVEQNYLKAKEYFELSAKHCNHRAYYLIGLIYKNGYGIPANYDKAKEYFELSANENNSDALYQLGTLNYYKFLLNSNYKIALNYFEESYKNGNLNALFYLGSMFENNEGVDKNLEKAIDFYKKCGEKRKYELIYKSNNDISIQEKTKTNYHFYQSNNNLGLIYITEPNYRNEKLAEEYLKIAGLNEYPIGQNNLGLFYQFYLNKINDAIYMFEKSSKNHFSIAEFNLGNYYEINKNIEQAIEHYLLESEYENNQIIFWEQMIIDKKLEISKLFIDCYTNLRLSKFYFYENNKSNDVKKAFNFFLKAIFRPLFYLLFHEEDESFVFNFDTNNNNCIVNLKNLIFGNKLFHDKNSNFIGWTSFKNNSMDFIELNLQINKSKKNIFNEMKNEKKCSCVNEIYFRNILDEIKNIFIYMSKYEQYEFISENLSDAKSEMIVVCIKNKNNNFKKCLRFPLFLCDLLFMNFNIMKESIDEILNEMYKMIYSPPYSILFGRFPYKNQSSEKISQNINNDFYNGFKFDNST